MTRRTILWAFVLVLVPGALAAARENLLRNPGAEDGETGWRPFFLERGDARLEVAADGAEGGGQAFVIRSRHRTFAMWQQRVPVEAGRVYEFSARMKVEAVRGRALLHVVFRGADGRILELVDLLPHRRTIDWFLAYPAPMLVRAPKGAVTAEVNLCLQGSGTAWFDDVHFGPPSEGTVRGTVTCDGEPVEGVRVFLYGSPFEAKTDAAGLYTLPRVPVRSPRYILMAEKDGFRTAVVGDLGTEEGQAREVNLSLVRGADPSDPLLRVKFGCLRHIEPAPPRRVESQAVIDASRYPAAVKVYLGPNEFIDSQSPAVQETAEKVLAAVPEADRRRTLPVAEAVFGWAIRNIEFDTTYDPGDAARRGLPANIAAALPGRPARFAPSNFTDTTSGKWQTISPTGWCWGHNFTDWLYKSSECLAAKRG
ncbi:MAG: carboxypeptidase-like regulatory domain-containing protein, partial [Planctomycetota bacterium]|nr:carboxypeptidase-like regulatory domain-containing protein [Planctomycetota bacterium]